MNGDTTSTRRSFLRGSALLAAPLAVAARVAVIADDTKARLARLEDEAAIRKLHHRWLQRLNSGAADTIVPAFPGPEDSSPDRTVCSIAADHAGHADAIEVAGDGRSACGRFHCAVEIGTAIVQDCTLARMAHAQGNSLLRRTERRSLRVRYVKSSGNWAIAKAEFAAPSA